MIGASQPTAFAGDEGELGAGARKTQLAITPVGGFRGPASRPGSRRGVRLRLTATYGALFLVCGAALLTITYLLVEGAPFAPPSNYNPPGRSGNGPIGIAVERHTVLHALLVRSGIALAIMALVSIWLGWIVAGRVLAPLRVITARTHEISETNLHERLALSGPADEIKELSDTIDGLLARLEEAFVAQRRFVANVSHELRTPLAMIRTSLDVAAGKPRPMSAEASVLSGKVREGLAQADRLVESFLVLAQAETGRVGDLETISLADLITAGLDDHADEIERQRLTVDLRAETVRMVGSPTLLARLVANVISNAARYNRPNGSILVTTHVSRDRVRLTVENDGQPIDPAEAAQLIEPFRRGGNERTGSGGGVGMGLAIVAAITSAHRGMIEVRARPQGGLTVIIELPGAATAAAGDAHG
jgi:signal transduction histidine kinase